MKKIVFILIGFFATGNVCASEMASCLGDFQKDFQGPAKAFIEYGTPQEFNELNYFNDYFIRNFDKCKKALVSNSGKTFKFDAGGLKATFEINKIKTEVANYLNKNSTKRLIRPCIIISDVDNGLRVYYKCAPPDTFRTYFGNELKKCFIDCKELIHQRYKEKKPTDALNIAFQSANLFLTYGKPSNFLCLDTSSQDFLFYEANYNGTGSVSRTPYAFDDDILLIKRLEQVIVGNSNIKKGCQSFIARDNSWNNGFQIDLVRPVYSPETLEIVTAGDAVKKIISFGTLRLF